MPLVQHPTPCILTMTMYAGVLEGDSFSSVLCLDFLFVLLQENKSLFFHDEGLSKEDTVNRV